jgi:hypothetical protein
MANTLPTAGYKANISATGNVCPRPCDMLGIFVSAASATPTITVYDSATTTTSDPIVTVFTPAPATYYAMPASTEVGVYVVIGGTVNCTVFFA